MEPEHTAYQNSPHARVKCVDCHVGSGAGWYVRSKLSGAYQVYAVLANVYPRPIPTPIKNLRPARETCEQCHWPSHFSGQKEVINTYFKSDEQNTRWTIASADEDRRRRAANRGRRPAFTGMRIPSVEITFVSSGLAAADYPLGAREKYPHREKQRSIVPRRITLSEEDLRALPDEQDGLYRLPQQAVAYLPAPEPHRGQQPGHRAHQHKAARHPCRGHQRSDRGVHKHGSRNGFYSAGPGGALSGRGFLSHAGAAGAGQPGLRRAAGAIPSQLFSPECMSAGKHTRTTSGT